MLKLPWRMMSISSSVKAPKIAILTLLESFFSPWKKECPRKVVRKKGSPSVCLSYLRLKIFEFDLMNHLKSLL